MHIKNHRILSLFFSCCHIMFATTGVLMTQHSHHRCKHEWEYWEGEREGVREKNWLWEAEIPIAHLNRSLYPFRWTNTSNIINCPPPFHWAQKKSGHFLWENLTLLTYLKILKTLDLVILYFMGRLYKMFS